MTWLERPTSGPIRIHARDWPQELSRTICRATLEQAKANAGDLVRTQCVDGNGNEHVNEVASEEPQWKSYWDDLTGRELDRHG